jgi:hypothetical protein
MADSRLILQFTITLLGIDPPVWRRIQVPAEYTFWDLHVAIQDSMGWLDCHLHMFSFGKRITIGIPDEEDPRNKTLPGWDTYVEEYFVSLGTRTLYDYDFGDGWRHDVLFEGILSRERGTKYPVCIGGARACPPEDCGGLGGYTDMISILRNPHHEEHRQMIGWLKGHAKNYYPFDPERFEPAQVLFDNPKRRLKRTIDP